MKKGLTFIDLFAGCGGLSEGFLQSGFYEALAHVEWEMPMVNTLRNRLVKKWNHNEEEAENRVIHFDIQKTNELIEGKWSEATKKKYGATNSNQISEHGLRGLIKNTEVDLIIGGPPCQAYSIAGRAQDKDSMKFDYRNYLFESFVEAVNFFRPKVFVFENVPGMLSARPGDIPVTERIFKAFSEINYSIRIPSRLKESVYSASDFGVPQKRKRVILIGVHNETDFDVETFYKEVERMKTDESKNVRDAIGHLPRFRPLGGTVKSNGKNRSHIAVDDNSVEFHEPRFHNERDIGIFERWIRNHMNKASSEDKISFYNDLMGKNSNHAKYRNLEWDKPSPTIVAHLYKDGLMFIHPDAEQSRSITVKEAALLQSFPEDFSFVGSIGSCYKMIGNAVPPLMAKGIARAIANVLQKKN